MSTLPLSKALDRVKDGYHNGLTVMPSCYKRAGNYIKQNNISSGTIHFHGLGPDKIAHASVTHSDGEHEHEERGVYPYHTSMPISSLKEGTMSKLLELAESLIISALVESTTTPSVFDNAESLLSHPYFKPISGNTKLVSGIRSLPGQITHAYTADGGEFEDKYHLLAPHFKTSSIHSRDLPHHSYTLGTVHGEPALHTYDQGEGKAIYIGTKK